MRKWIIAARPRTLVLSFSCLGMGHVLAYSFNSEAFNWSICFLSFATILQLQILSNFANDLGDTLNGADNHLRQGPSRMVQTGSIHLNVMKTAVLSLSATTFITGITLLLLSLHSLTEWLTFLGLGIASILAAIGYTMGKRPYGYVGLGDFAVFVFFGLVAVLGSFYLQVHQLPKNLILPAIAMGLLATSVLNINNLRDINSDIIARKFSIPVRIGLENGKWYQLFLFFTSILLASIYLFQFSQTQFPLFLLLIALPTARILIQLFRSYTAESLDKLLKPTAFLSLLYLLGFWLILIIL